MSVSEKKWRGFFFVFFLMEKGDSTSGRGCTSGVQGAKAQPAEEVAPWRGEGGRRGGGGVGLRARVFKNTEISGSKFLCTS